MNTITPHSLNKLKEKITQFLSFWLAKHLPTRGTKQFKFNAIRNCVRSHVGPARYDKANTSLYRSYLSRWIRLEIVKIVEREKYGEFIKGPTGKKLGVILESKIAPSPKHKSNPIHERLAKSWRNDTKIENRAREISKEINSYAKQMKFKGNSETLIVEIKSNEFLLLIDAWHELRDILDPIRTKADLAAANHQLTELDKTLAEKEAKLEKSIEELETKFPV